MSIQWYPGHMKKARDEITEAMGRIDVVIEMLDARLPASSRNPVLDDLRRDKPCIRLLNKSDLADPAVTALWIGSMESDRSVRALSVEAHDHTLSRFLPVMCRERVKIPPKRPVRVMVVGIPNVGKSTLINTLVGKRLAKVGNQPAVTRRPQTVRITVDGDAMDVLDTPGILWPNLENKKGAYRLAAGGAIRDTAMDYEDVAAFTGAFLLDRYPGALMDRYRFKQLPDSAQALLDAVGRKRGCLIRGGRVDLHKAALALMLDLRSGKIGRISLEEPRDWESDSSNAPDAADK
ncbi:ribosome biogenesis GTPase YlqF [Desulfatiferula olefinivorans]